MNLVPVSFKGAVGLIDARRDQSPVAFAIGIYLKDPVLSPKTLLVMRHLP
jgi:hypothetical protein